MALTKSLAALASKLRSKVARKRNGKFANTTISATFNLVQSMSPLGQQMYGGNLYLVDIYSPTSPYYEPAFPLKHKVQLPGAHAEQQQPATSLPAQQQDSDLRNSKDEVSNTSSFSGDATSEHHDLDKDLPRCETSSEPLFWPSEPASPTSSSRSSRTPSPIFNSVTSFDKVDSPAVSTATEADRFTELPPRVFPLRRTARVQRKVITSPVEFYITTLTDPFATLFSGPSPSSSTHSLASLANFGDRLSLAKEVESGLVRIVRVITFTLITTANTLDALFAGPSPSCSVNSLASLTLADLTSLEEDIKMGVVSVGDVLSYHSRALPATPAVESEGCFAIVEKW